MDKYTTSGPANACGQQNGDASEKLREDLARATFGAYAERVDVWLDPNSEPHATLPGRINVRLDSREMRDLLSAEHYRREGEPIADRTLEGLLSSMAGMARAGRERYDTRIRVASTDSAIYLDLVDEHGQVVEITSAGWRVTSDYPKEIKFVRPRSLRSLPKPVQGGSLDALWACTNLPDDAHRQLVAGWLLGALMPDGPYPALILNGQAGSAKSTATRLVRSVIDPSAAALRPPPSGPQNLAAMVANTYVVALDNVSGLSAEMSDRLCRVASGTALGGRQLYTDSDEAITAGARPIIANGIPTLAHRGDLAQRAIQLQLPRIEGAKRRTEAEVFAQFAAAHPAILGALLDGVVMALTHAPTIEMKHLPRMADWAKWVTAAEPAFGWSTGSIAIAFERCQAEANEDALANDPLAQAVIKLVAEKGDTEQTPTRLYQILKGCIEIQGGGVGTMPRTVRGLSEGLMRLAPGLAAIGIEITRTRSAQERKIRVRRIPVD